MSRGQVCKESRGEALSSARAHTKTDPSQGVRQLFKKQQNLTPFGKLYIRSKTEVSFPQRHHRVEKHSGGIPWDPGRNRGSATS